jgi:hypothetical protein
MPFCTKSAAGACHALSKSVAMNDTPIVPHRQETARILLVIRFPTDIATITTLDSRDFQAFSEGAFEAQLSAFGE